MTWIRPAVAQVSHVPHSRHQTDAVHPWSASNPSAVPFCLNHARSIRTAARQLFQVTLSLVISESAPSVEVQETIVHLHVSAVRTISAVEVNASYCSTFCPAKDYLSLLSMQYLSITNFV